MLGWVGHSGFYLFRCKNCESASVDYPHGYTDFGLIYLRCDKCEQNLSLEISEEKGIYEREGVYIPPSTLEERKKEFREVSKTLEGETGRRHKDGRQGFFRRFFRRLNLHLH